MRELVHKPTHSLLPTNRTLATILFGKDYLVPATIEVRDVTTGQSVIHVLNITRLAGDEGFVYSCQSEGFPVPTVTWSRGGFACWSDSKRIKF